VVGVEAALGIERARTEGPFFKGKVPPLGSHYAFELHELKKGAYSVRVKFASSDGEQTIPIPGCSGEFCPLKKFRSVVASAIPKNWRAECAGKPAKRSWFSFGRGDSASTAPIVATSPPAEPPKAPKSRPQSPAPQIAAKPAPKAESLLPPQEKTIAKPKQVTAATPPTGPLAPDASTIFPRSSPTQAAVKAEANAKVKAKSEAAAEAKAKAEAKVAAEAEAKAKAAAEAETKAAAEAKAKAAAEAKTAAEAKAKAEAEAKAAVAAKAKAAAEAKARAEAKAKAKAKPAPNVKVAKLANPKPTAPKAGGVATGGGFQVQLGAMRSASRAKAQARRLNRSLKGVLKGNKIRVVRSNLGKRGVYHRLRAGPVRNRTAAKALCSALAKRKVGCIVIKP
jgi:TolA protein